MTTITTLEEHVADNIGHLLLAARRSQKALAAAIHLDAGQFSKRMSGAVPFKVREVAQIAQVFDIDGAALFLEPAAFKAWLDKQPKLLLDLTRQALTTSSDLHSAGTRCFLPGLEGPYNAMGHQARLFDDEGNIIDYETGDPSPLPAVIDLRDPAVTIPAPLQHEGAVAA